MSMRSWSWSRSTAVQTAGLRPVRGRNVLAQVPKGNGEMALAAIRTVFAQPDAEHVSEQFDVIAAMLGRQLPKVSGS